MYCESWGFPGANMGVTAPDKHVVYMHEPDQRGAYPLWGLPNPNPSSFASLHVSPTAFRGYLGDPRDVFSMDFASVPNCHPFTSPYTS